MHSPCNLLILSLPRFDLQAPIVHLMYIASFSHVAENILLKIRNRIERVGYVLVLLYITNHLGRLGPLGKIDEVGVFDDRRNSIFDEGQIRKINTEKRYAGWVRLA